MKMSIGSILTIDELAEYLKISKSTLYRLAQEGTVPGQRSGGTGASLKRQSIVGRSTMARRIDRNEVESDGYQD
jgi:excisionase family DNA binding protein